MIGLDEKTIGIIECPGVCTTNVSEERALEDALGNRAHIERDETTATPRRHVDRLRDELLPRAGLPFDEHGQASRRDTRNEIADAVHDLTASQQCAYGANGTPRIVRIDGHGALGIAQWIRGAGAHMIPE